MRLLAETPREKRRGALVLVVFMALLETAGVASVLPFLAVLGNPEMLEMVPGFLLLPPLCITLRITFILPRQ